MRFRDLARKNEADARSLGFRGEERHEEIRAALDARTLVLDAQLEHAVASRPTDSDASMRLERRVDGVAYEIDEQLVELIAVRANRDRRSVLDPYRKSRLERGDAPHPRGDVDGGALRRRQPREPRVRRHETHERVGASGDDGEPALGVVVRVRGTGLSVENGLQAARERFDRRE